MLKLYKYQGAGNDFLIADNRNRQIVAKDGIMTLRTSDGVSWSKSIAEICDRRYGVGADGLMLLESSDRHDFKMAYFNADGSGGMMCGNGGRCIVAFAADRGIGHFDFDAADGFHTACILDCNGREKTVCLKMKDVTDYQRYDALTGPSVPSDGYFLDTGTRHYVRFIQDAESYDVFAEGRDIRHNASELLPVGANVNFVEAVQGGLKVRTYEKGVEDETFACGTGIVASAVASYISGIVPSRTDPDGRVHYDIRAKRDRLSVDFIPGTVGAAALDVHLTGPAAFVAEIIL